MSNDMFLLTLKGQVSVTYLDGEILVGEFATQDSFNIFLTINDEPIMIPRSQIRYIKGQTGQAIESDTSQPDFVGHGPAQQAGAPKPPPKTVPSIWDTDVSELADADSLTDQAKESPPVTAFIDEEEETVYLDEEQEDSTVFLDEDDTDVTVFLDEEEEDSTVFLDQDEEDATVFLTEEEDDDDGTLIVGGSKPSRPTITAYMDCVGGPHAGQRFDLQPGTNTFGRSSDNLFPLSSDKEISRRHAIVTYQPNGTFVIEDRGSLNGVIINDIRIEAPYTLKEADSILLGVSVLVYHDK